MKDYKIIVTRDKDGLIIIWSSDAHIKRNADGNWQECEPVAKAHWAIRSEGHFKSMFGFLPHKGSKAVYVLREQK